MNLESKLGARIFELRDVVKSSVVNSLLDTFKECNVDINIDQLQIVKRTVEASIDSTFYAGLNNVFSVIQK